MFMIMPQKFPCIDLQNASNYKGILSPPLSKNITKKEFHVDESKLGNVNGRKQFHQVASISKATMSKHTSLLMVA